MTAGTNRPSIWSFGGGTQSAAIAALIVRGDLPPPEVALIADTSREGSETFPYLRDVVQPALDAVGVHIHIVPHDLATVDLWTGAAGDTVIMPMFTSQQGRGMLPKYCSHEWKTRPVQRWLRRYGYSSGEMWIGFSTDEMQRCRVPQEPYPHRYPLIEKRLSRSDCVALVERMGWPTPPRSACYQCPYMSDQERQRQPREDFQKAVALEKEIQKRDPHVWLHRSCQPLDSIKFDEQHDMFADECASGMCFT
jgi:hypothetical protein